MTIIRRNPIYYQGLAWQKLGNVKEANRRFNKLIDYAERHMHDHIRMDYFAVSLPDFLVFDDDLDQRNEEHCRYMRALGLLGLGGQVKPNLSWSEYWRKTRIIRESSIDN